MNELTTGDFTLFDGIEPSDIKQGKLGDCWFACALASVAEWPELVRRLYISQHKSQENVYRLQLYRSGLPVAITVDDMLPAEHGDIDKGPDPLYAP